MATRSNNPPSRVNKVPSGVKNTTPKSKTTKNFYKENEKKRKRKRERKTERKKAK